MQDLSEASDRADEEASRDEQSADAGSESSQCSDPPATASREEAADSSSPSDADAAAGEALQCLSGIDETADQLLCELGEVAGSLPDEPAPEAGPEAHDLAQLEAFRDGVLKVAKRGPKPVKWIATGVQTVIEFAEKSTDEQLELSNKLLRKSPPFFRRFLEWATQLGE